jgi:hypothetical protein
MIYVAEITAAIDAAGNTQVFLFSTLGFATAPTDTPPNTVARERLLQPGNYQRDMGANRTLFGQARAAFGELQLANADGALDAFARYGLAWRQVRLLACDATYAALPAYPSGWTVVLVATVDTVTQGYEVLTLRLRDKLDLLDKPACARFAGTGGIEGPAQLAGHAKPRLYGSACNVAPEVIDSTNSVYMLSDKPATQPRWVFDKRSVLTPVSNNYNDAADFATLQALTVASGSYARCSDAGLFKLGTAAQGRVTVDGIRHDLAYSTTFGRSRLGEVLYDVAIDAGLAPAEIDPALQTLAVPGNSHGYFIKDLTTTYAQVLGALAASGGAWVGSNRLGVLTAGIVAAPSGTPVWTFTRDNAIGLQLIQGPYPVPIASATVRGGRNWTTMVPAEIDTGLSSQGDREALGRGWCYTEQAVGTAITKHLAAQPEVFDTCSGPAGAVVATVLPGNGVGFSAATALALFGVERDTAQLRAGLSLALLTTVDLGSVVQVVWSRFGYAAGKLMLVTGIRYDFARGECTFTLWG